MGNEIGKKLAEKLNAEIVDREVLEEKFQKRDVNIETLLKYDEKHPKFWSLFDAEKDRYFHYMAETILGYASNGNCVILGRGSQVLLSGVSGVLHVRIIAPREWRVRHLIESLQYSESHAEETVTKSDHDQAKYIKSYYDHEMDEPQLYHMILNTSRMKDEEVINVIMKAAEMKEKFLDTSMIKDLLIEQNIFVMLKYERHIPIQNFSVRVREGVVTLRGSTISDEAIISVSQLVEKIPGIRQVNNELFRAYAYTPHGMY